MTNNQSGEELHNMVVQKIEEFVEAYSKMLIQYRETSKGNVYNSRFLTFRPWLKVESKSQVSVELRYLKQGLDMKKLSNAFEYVEQTISSGKKFKYPILLKRIEDQLFDFTPISNEDIAIDKLNENMLNNKTDKTMVSVNNGEVYLLVQNLNSVQATSIELRGSRANQKTEIISSMQRDFEGIRINLVRKNIVPLKIEIDESISGKAREQSIIELGKKYDSMTELSKLLWMIAIDRFITLSAEQRLQNGTAYISFEDIHFNYRKAEGAGEYGNSVPTKAVNAYIEAFRELEKYSVDIDYSNVSNRMARYFIGNKPGKNRLRHIVINSSLFKIVDIIYAKGEIESNDNGKIMANRNSKNIPLGITYQLGEIGQIYMQDVAISTFNFNYTKDIMGLNVNYCGTAINIANFLEYKHRVHLNKKSHVYKFSINKLIEESKHEVTSKRFARTYNNLLKQLDIAASILIENNKIEYIKIPKDVKASQINNFDNIYFEVKFIYDTSTVDNN